MSLEQQTNSQKILMNISIFWKDQTKKSQDSEIHLIKTQILLQQLRWPMKGNLLKKYQIQQNVKG